MEGLLSYSSVLQLLQKIRQVNFTLYKSRISFDTNGDICKGYDIVMWKWSGPNWTSDVIGTFRVNPDRLSLTQAKSCGTQKMARYCSAPKSYLLLTSELTASQCHEFWGVSS